MTLMLAKGPPSSTESASSPSAPAEPGTSNPQATRIAVARRFSCLSIPRSKISEQGTPNTVCDEDFSWACAAPAKATTLPIQSCTIFIEVRPQEPPEEFLGG